MALDYVKSLREMDAAGGEVTRPTVKRTDEDIAKVEAVARAIEYENGRYGRFVDQRGKWATAWQAHGPKTPLVPPRFVSPGVIRRSSTGELTLVPPEGEALLINPQQWVVLYDGSGDAIIADDDQFRAVMTSEATVRRKVQAEVEEQDEQEEPQEAGPGVYAQPTPVSAPGNPIPYQMVPSVSIDGFVAQVLIDNQRLRQELAMANTGADHLREQRDKLERANEAWRNELGMVRDRAVRLWNHVAKAMGWTEANGPAPTDRDLEEFLDEAGRIWAEDKAKVEEAKREREAPATEPEKKAEVSTEELNTHYDPPAKRTKLSPTPRKEA